jgi:glycosyltransferase involved in cell wall biosynthesis
MHTGSTQSVKQPKLVTVVITCFNHAGYLTDAIKSVLGQSYKPVEIIVVDDGSTDNTREVAEGFKEVKYVYQTNQGLPAARNTGIAASTGEYLVFLDADDWLLPQAIVTNVKYFEADKQIGLVSGSYAKFFEQTGKLVPIEKYISHDVYAELLLSNYLRMHGAVMFSRVVFEQLQYDTHLRSSEDWDMTLAVSRRYPIIQHKEPIAIYRKYGSSMSSNLVVMLESGVTVLDKQKTRVRTAKETQNLRTGRRTLVRKFTKRIYSKISKHGGTKAEIRALLKYNPVLFLKYNLKRISLRLKRR